MFRTETLAAILVATGVAAGQERYPIFTEDHLSSTMETLGPNVTAARASVESGDFETAKAQLVRSREQLATTITFWRDRDLQDGVAYLRDALQRMDDLDGVLSSRPVDTAESARLLGEVEAACQACHAVYRAQDPDTGEYRVNLQP